MSGKWLNNTVLKTTVIAGLLLAFGALAYLRANSMTAKEACLENLKKIDAFNQQQTSKTTAAVLI